MILRDQDGKSVSLDDKPLGSGGEADVLPVTGQPKLAAKIYKAYSSERTNKLKAMVEAPPQDVARNKGHISICWPVGKLFNSADRCVGFLMPRLDFTNYRELLVLYNPQDRREEAPTFTWQYLVKTAENLSIVVASVHSKGHVIGDLNESNLFVSDQALVTLVDCDSMQIRTSTTTFRCEVAKAEYLAPELIGKDLSKVDRAPEQDSFALAILIFMLLMEGVHPYSGSGPGDDNLPQDHIATGDCPYAGSTRVAAKRTAPSFDSLPASVRVLFTRAFGKGHNNPDARPAAKEWAETLSEIRLATCTVNEMHVYSKHLGGSCPWCARAALSGGLDPFPAIAASFQQVPLKAQTFSGPGTATKSPSQSKTPLPLGSKSTNKTATPQPSLTPPPTPQPASRGLRVGVVFPCLLGLVTLVLMGAVSLLGHEYAFIFRMIVARYLWAAALVLLLALNLKRRKVLACLSIAVVFIATWAFPNLTNSVEASAILTAIAAFLSSRAAILLFEAPLRQMSIRQPVKAFLSSALLSVVPATAALAIAGFQLAPSATPDPVPIANGPSLPPVQMAACSKLKKACTCDVQTSFFPGETAYLLLTSTGSPDIDVSIGFPGAFAQPVPFINPWHSGGTGFCRSASLPIPQEVQGGSAQLQLTVRNGTQNAVTQSAINLFLRPSSEAAADTIAGQDVQPPNADVSSNGSSASGGNTASAQPAVVESGPVRTPVAPPAPPPPPPATAPAATALDQVPRPQSAVSPYFAANSEKKPEESSGIVSGNTGMAPARPSAYTPNPNVVAELEKAKSEVGTTLQAWAAAAGSTDTKREMSFFANTVTMNNMTVDRSALEKAKKQAVDRGLRFESYKLSNVQITAHQPDQAEVRLGVVSVANGIVSVNHYLMYLHRFTDGWKITLELKTDKS